MRDRGKDGILKAMILRSCIFPVLLLFSAVAPLCGQGPDGDAWYYERIAVQERPEAAGEVFPPSWQDRWNPFVRRLGSEISAVVRKERELPRLRFELQGDRSNKFALFRCIESEADFVLSWRVAEALPLDEIFLLPTRIPQADGSIRQLGFPLKSRLEVSASGDFDRDLESYPIPEEDVAEASGFPVRVKLSGKPAVAWRWVIEEPFAPFKIGYLAVSEIFVLSGNRNVAAQGTLAWSASFLPDRSMAPSFLQDGNTPLGLPLIREETLVLGYHSEIKNQAEVEEEWIELTWAEPQALSAIRLIPAQQRVLPHTETFGFPLAHRTDFFLDGEKIESRRARYAIDPGQNVVTIPAVDGRLVDRVRWTATELWQRRESHFLALAEFEALNREGENIAGDAVLRVSSEGIENQIWNLAALTDGLASEGRLIPVGVWLRGLDEARQLRSGRIALLAAREEAIRDTNRACLVGLLGIFGLIVGLFARSRVRERARARLESAEFRKRLAEDLHDDLGGNLGSIVLLADQARSEQDPSSAVASDLSRVVQLARESRNHLRTILEVSDGGFGLALDEEAFFSRLRLTVGDFFGSGAGEFRVAEGAGERVASLTEKQRGEILLFCKEALHNLRQHGDASRVQVEIEPQEDGIVLRIEDDSSLSITEEGVLLSKSLRARAQRLSREVSNEGEHSGAGNSLRLRISTKKG